MQTPHATIMPSLEFWHHHHHGAAPENYPKKTTRTDPNAGPIHLQFVTLSRTDRLSGRAVHFV